MEMADRSDAGGWSDSGGLSDAGDWSDTNYGNSWQEVRNTRRKPKPNHFDKLFDGYGGGLEKVREMIYQYAWAHEPYDTAKGDLVLSETGVDRNVRRFNMTWDPDRDNWTKRSYKGAIRTLLIGNKKFADEFIEYIYSNSSLDINIDLKAQETEESKAALAKIVSTLDSHPNFAGFTHNIRVRVHFPDNYQRHHLPSFNECTIESIANRLQMFRLHNLTVQAVMMRGLNDYELQLCAFPFYPLRFMAWKMQVFNLVTYQFERLSANTLHHLDIAWDAYVTKRYFTFPVSDDEAADASDAGSSRAIVDTATLGRDTGPAEADFSTGGDAEEMGHKEQLEANDQTGSTEAAEQIKEPMVNHGPKASSKVTAGHKGGNQFKAEVDGGRNEDGNRRRANRRRTKQSRRTMKRNSHDESMIETSLEANLPVQTDHQTSLLDSPELAHSTSPASLTTPDSSPASSATARGSHFPENLPALGQLQGINSSATTGNAGLDEQLSDDGQKVDDTQDATGKKKKRKRNKKKKKKAATEGSIMAAEPVVSNPAATSSVTRVTHIRGNPLVTMEGLHELLRALNILPRQSNTPTNPTLGDSDENTSLATPEGSSYLTPGEAANEAPSQGNSAPPNAQQGRRVRYPRNYNRRLREAAGPLSRMRANLFEQDDTEQPQDPARVVADTSEDPFANIEDFETIVNRSSPQLGESTGEMTGTDDITDEDFTGQVDGPVEHRGSPANPPA